MEMMHYGKIVTLAQIYNIIKMQEEIILTQQKWHKGKLPFAGHKEKFAAIPKSERSAYNTKMLETKQNPNPPPVIYKKDYKNQSKFKYGDYQLHYYYIENTQQPQAIVIYVHGMNAHGGGSGYLAHTVTQANPKVNFYAFDQMNFGQSSGPYRGEVASFEDSISQTETFVQFLLKKLKSKPKVFLSGGSYGGSISFKASIKSPERYAGVIFLAPAIRNLAQSGAFMKKVGKCIGFLCPRVRLMKDKYDSGTKHNQAERVMADPYVYNDGLVPGSVRTILSAIEEVSQLYKDFSTPYILFQAGVDKLVDPFAPLDLQQQCKSQDKTTVYCQNMWHAVLAEEEMEGIAWMVAEWIKQRL